jgi:hypothetical protein
MQKKIIVSLIFIFGCDYAMATTPAEKHSFHVVGSVSYRCYTGYKGVTLTDDMTKNPCDNKTYKSTVIDKVISITIKDEPDPENSKDLEGSWIENFEYQGRKFEIAISLFKMSPTNIYRVRLVAVDNEPTPRQTAIYSEMKNVKKMNPLAVDYSSIGKKEEINFLVTISPPL